MSNLTDFIATLDSNRNDYKMGTLIEAFKAAGHAKSPSWLLRQEAKGNLILPRSTTNFRKAMGTRPIGFVRIVSPKQIQEIVEAFIPGGKGFYDYKEE